MHDTVLRIYCINLLFFKCRKVEVMGYVWKLFLHTTSVHAPGKSHIFHSWTIPSLISLNIKELQLTQTIETNLNVFKIIIMFFMTTMNQ